jgi:hypothetical protein
MNAVIETERMLREGYSGSPKDQNENIMSAVISLASRSISEESVDNILRDALRNVHRLFDFQDVAIALKDRDGMFRYKVQLGLSAEAEKTYFEIVYSPSDLFDDASFPSTAVSEITRFYMAENSPYKANEIGSYARPTHITDKRTMANDMIEGDYIDIYIRDWKNEVIGYFELAATRGKKLPTRDTIMWIELIATLLGMLISKKVGGGKGE